jgi:hypothetical protein
MTEFKMQERVDPQNFGKLWKPVNPGEQLTGRVSEVGIKKFEKKNNDGTNRTEDTKYLIITGVASGPGVPPQGNLLWQTPAHTDLVRRLDNIKRGDTVQITFTGYGDKSSRKYTVGVAG